MAFTINNTGSNSVTYQGVTINAGDSFTPDAPGTNFAEDFIFIKDLISQTVTITIGSDVYTGDTALKIINAIVQKSTIIDPNNSTIIPLTANSTFTGTWTEVSSYSNLSVILYTDQISATNGLKIQHSIDGISSDDYDAFTISANSGHQYSFPLTSKYYRIVYTNGITNQATLRLQAKLHENRPKPSSHRLSDSVSLESDAELNKSVISGIKANGTTENIRASDNYELQISDILNNGGTQGAISVSTSAVAVRVSGSNLTNRKNLTIWNNGTATLYWGYTNAVTSSSGTPLMRNQFVVGDWGPGTTIYIIAASGTHDVRVTEGA